MTRAATTPRQFIVDKALVFAAREVLGAIRELERHGGTLHVLEPVAVMLEQHVTVVRMRQVTAQILPEHDVDGKPSRRLPLLVDISRTAHSSPA